MPLALPVLCPEVRRVALAPPVPRPSRGHACWSSRTPGSIAEVGLDGKLIAVHPLGLAAGECIGHLRAATAAGGKRYVAAFLWMQQRVHLLDEKWNVLCHYPNDALQNPHSGITDVELGDLTGDGNPKLFMGYAGVVGVQEASLDGHRIWFNRQVYNVSRLAVGETNPNGRRALLVADGSGGNYGLGRPGSGAGPNRTGRAAACVRSSARTWPSRMSPASLGRAG